MQSLAAPLRNKLENTIKAAREAAEEAARSALEYLGVGEKEKPIHLTDEQAQLRVRLRAHARQLGDVRHADGRQGIEHLVVETAYEQWHRMLFARFLAENHLLMHPDGVAVSLAECEELAPDEGAANGWELAGNYAARMLPQVFRRDSPVLRVPFAPNDQRALERLLAGLDAEIFAADDSLGWVYQFWQAKKKDEVNKSEVKIGADELSAVTQLFTEPYMVQFLLHNSLGAWWVVNHPGEPCPVELTYLRTTSPPGPLSLKTGEGECLDPVLSSRCTASDGLSLKTGEGECLKGWEERDGIVTTLGGMPHSSVVTGNPVSKEKLELARKFRKEPTPEEALVWEWVRSRRLNGLKFRRQQIIEGFIADFYCAELRLALELDGAVHDTPAARDYDEIRDAVFANKGVSVLRIRNTNCTHEHIQEQLTRIQKELSSSPKNKCTRNKENKGLPPSPESKYAENKGLLLSPESKYAENKGLLPSPERRGAGGEVVGIPAAGAYEGWPKRLAGLKLLDPCCGSGHFLVAAFLMLVSMRMQEEGLSASDACAAVLRDNIHGLELDQRCVEIAAFALALAAWSYPDAGGYRELPEMHLACCGLAINAKREEWLALAGDDPIFRKGMGQLYDLFADAPVLGSLINPKRSNVGDLLTASYTELKPYLLKALDNELTNVDCEAEEMGVAAQGLSKAAELLSDKYHLVVTNVPYLKRGNQCDKLKEFCDLWYSKAKNDLANAFLERCLELNIEFGSTQIVMPQNWLFQNSYEQQREELLKNYKFNLLARLGARAFDTISGEVVNVILLTLCHEHPSKDHYMHVLDASSTRIIFEKIRILNTDAMTSSSQSSQLTNKNKIIVIGEMSSSNTVGAIAKSVQGIKTGDDGKLRRNFWEIINVLAEWAYYQSTVSNNTYFGGLEHIIYWKDNGFGLARRQGTIAWGKAGLAISQMSSLPCSMFLSEKFDSNMTAVIPIKQDLYKPLIAFGFSGEFANEVRKIDTSLKPTNSSFEKAPFDLPYWQQLAAERYPNGLPKPYSDDPTQWIFHGHPVPATSPLQVAVARLLGYRWPAETDEKMELSDDARTWINRCATLDNLVDDDGIVCIPPVRGEKPAAERLLSLLATAWGDTWSPAVHSKLLSDADCTGKTLEFWLRDKFFEQHFKLFHHRPFIWHIWDGVNDGFAALVNYHKLTRQNLETLIYTYLGDWIKHQEDEIKQGIDGATIRLAAAQKLKAELEKILEGEKPCDIFVRWKSLSQQPIGWEPDLNDGVRLNIRPFMTAGILRKSPNINWNKDRGKDVESAPWFHKFGGDRINDHHLTLAEKKATKQNDK